MGRAARARYPEAWDVSRPCIARETPSTPCCIRSSPNIWRPSWARWRRLATAWFTDVVNPSAPFDQTPEALTVLDQWLENIIANPELGVTRNKPALATDRCFDDSGAEIASGANVWDGILNGLAAGACTTRFPIYSTSRRVAGGPFEQSIFKCALQPVSAAIARGLYGVWTPTAAEQQVLERIFPEGVCDYSQPDAGRPAGW